MVFCCEDERPENGAKIKKIESGGVPRARRATRRFARDPTDSHLLLSNEKGNADLLTTP